MRERLRSGTLAEGHALAEPSDVVHSGRRQRDISDEFGPASLDSCSSVVSRYCNIEGGALETARVDFASSYVCSQECQGIQ